MRLRFLSFRELRNTPGTLWRILRSNVTVALTSKGVPKALVIGIDGEDLEEALLVAKRVRAQLAFSRMRTRARSLGLDRVSEEVVETEIRAERRR